MTHVMRPTLALAVCAVCAVVCVCVRVCACCAPASGDGRGAEKEGIRVGHLPRALRQIDQEAA
jgi:hypothetical protein